MRIRVHRQPVKIVKGTGRFERTRDRLETKEVEAENIFGFGIYVRFPMNETRVFNKYNGAGRGRMVDWIIDPEDHRKLLAEKPKKEAKAEEVVSASADW